MGLFSIIGRMSLNTADFDAGLKRAESGAKAAGTAIRNTLGAVITAAAIGGAARAIGQWTDNVLNLADAYQISTSQVQKASEAAMMNGVSVEQLLASTVKLNEARAKALEGDENAIKNFAALGISMDELRNRQHQSFDLTGKVAEAMASGANKIETQSAATEILGNRSVRLAQALRDINKESPLIIIEDEQLRKLDAAFDKFELLAENVKRYGAEILTLGVERFEATSRNQPNSMKPLAGIAAIMDMATEFIANAFGKSVFTPENARHEAFKIPEKAAESMFQEDSEGVGIESKTNKAAAEKRYNPFIQTSGMAQSGFGYFGGGYNQQVLSELGKQVKALEKIATATTNTAEALKPE